MRIQNSDMFLNQDVAIAQSLMKQINQHKRNMRENPEMASSSTLPHGLLGQTWSSKTYANRWKHIEGQLFSYVVNDGLFGSDFEFNRFQRV